MSIARWARRGDAGPVGEKFARIRRVAVIERYGLLWVWRAFRRLAG